MMKWFLAAKHVLFTFLTTCLVFYPTKTYGLSFQSLPTCLKINQVTQSYPPTLFRTLFSSVPKRDLAVNNITLKVQSELLNILGASSSGKSTILRLVLGENESPVSGTVSWTPSDVRPICLEQGKSPYAYERSQTVETILQNICMDDCNVGDWEAIVAFYCNIVGLSTNEVLSTPSELSPSNLYRFSLVKASLESILPALNAQISQQDTLPSPLLLLDEWMDLETSSIVRRVEESMLNLTRHGAVILCVTHKPQFFSKSHRSITMCRGEILFESNNEK